MRFPHPFVAALAALAIPAGGAGAESPVACTVPVAPSGVLAPWTAQTPLAAVGTDDRLSQALLPVGQAAALALLPSLRVAYPRQPGKPGGPDSHGGLIGLDVAEAGVYRVALGSGAWVDLVRDGKAVASVSHGHGPPCSTIRKMVDFSLEPGRYALQIARSDASSIGVLVARIR